MPTPTSTIRVPARTYDRLKGLARAAGKPMSAVLEEAVERYEADRFFRDADAAYQRLRAHPEAWKQELAERSLLEQTLQDGLEEE
jgi:predicted DNA-binding protein